MSTGTGLWVYAASLLRWNTDVVAFESRTHFGVMHAEERAEVHGFVLGLFAVPLPEGFKRWRVMSVEVYEVDSEVLEQAGFVRNAGSQETLQE